MQEGILWRRRKDGRAGEHRRGGRIFGGRNAPALISSPHRSHLISHARNCPTEIILLVWRLVPQVKPAHEGMTRRSSCKSSYDLQSPPQKREKNGPAQAEQRRSCHILYDGTEGLGLHTWDRYTELGKRGQNTLPALSRVPSAADQNYIILAPLNPGSQVGLGGCTWLCAAASPGPCFSLIQHHL